MDPDESAVDGGEAAAEVAAAVRAGERDPVEVVRAAFRRIAQRDGEIRAFAALREERALAEAALLSRRPDLERLPLAGVPVAVKDVLDVGGEPTRVGSEAVRPRDAVLDAEIVRRLRAAGAIVVGKTTAPEMAIWATTDGPAGVTRNPRDPSRTAGGSSGGSGAAVASGMVPLAVGTDGLGSVRIPAAACGIAGLKFGGGVAPVGVTGGDWRGMTVNGPLGRTVGDVALAASVMAARPRLAGAAVDRPLLAAVSSKTPLPGGTVDPAWAAVPGVAGALLDGTGHRVIEAHPPYSVLNALPVFSRWFAGVADELDELEAEGLLDRSGLQRRTRMHAALGRLVRATGGPRDGRKRKWREQADAFFRTYDILLTPALAHPPIAAREWSRRGWLANVLSNARYAPFAAAWNLAGLPAGVVPLGRHPNGLPLAVQVVGGRGQDARVLAVMRAIEAAARGRS